MTSIRTTVTPRTEARAELEKAAASALLDRKITSDEYKELVKPNLTDADLAADLAIAEKIAKGAMKDAKGGLVPPALAMAEAIYRNLGADLPDDQQARVQQAIDRAIALRNQAPAAAPARKNEAWAPDAGKAAAARAPRPAAPAPEPVLTGRVELTAQEKADQAAAKDVAADLKKNFANLPQDQRTAMTSDKMQSAAAAIDKFNRLTPDQQKLAREADPMVDGYLQQLSRSPGVAAFVGQPEVVTIVGKRPTLTAAEQQTMTTLADAANHKVKLSPDQKVALKNELIAIAKKMPKNFIDGVSKENIRLQLQIESALSVAAKREILKAARA